MTALTASIVAAVRLEQGEGGGGGGGGDSNYSSDASFASVEPPTLSGSLVVYCPGMPPAERNRRAFELRLAADGAFEATFGGGFGALTLEEFLVVVKGTDSESVAPGVGPRTWVPLPSLSAVDVEGFVTARVSLDLFGGDSDAFDAVSGVSMGANVGVDAWFRKEAGVDSALERRINVTAKVFFDYVGDGVEAHVTADFASPCVAGGAHALGTVNVTVPHKVRRCGLTSR